MRSATPTNRIPTAGPRTTWGSLLLVLLLAVAGCASTDDTATTTTTVPAGVDPSPSTVTTGAPTSTSGVATDPAAAMPAIEGDGTARWVPEVIARLPHDPDAFTQGLLVDEGTIYESTGLYGESSLRRVDPDTGEVLEQQDLDPDLFGEGLELVGDRLLQLTWQEETLLVWDSATFEETDRIGYEGEGWGLCHDGDRLVMSDGSATLTLRDPESFEIVGEVEVIMDGEPVTQLNELECVDDFVFANVWQTTDIVVIDPGSGDVVAAIDATSLDEELADVADRDVLNGIAYDPDAGTFLLTGKLWPTLFVTRFVEEEPR